MKSTGSVLLLILMTFWSMTSLAVDNRLMQALLGSQQIQGRYFMVLSSGVAANDGLWNGNLGGLAGANSKCLSDLNKYDWFGKNKIISLNSQTVKAFLCDGTTCQEPQANTGYVFARANSTVSGGASLYAGTLGIGPTIDWDAQVDTTTWSGGLYFGVSGNYWSGRGAGTDTAWSSTSDTNRCTVWASSSGGVTGRVGVTAGTLPTAYWSGTTNVCSTNLRLVCMVTQPGMDDQPDAFDFSDLTLVTKNSSHEASSVLAGFAGSLLASVMVDSGTSRQVRKNGAGSWASSVEISAGDTLNLRMQSPTTPATAKKMTVTVGQGIADFDLTTLDDQPDVFTLTDLWALTQSTQYSTSFVPTGFDVAVPASVTGGGAEISTDNATWVTSLTISPAQTLYIRMTSSATAGAVVTTTVTIGGAGVTVSDNWDLMNARDNILVLTSTLWNGNLGGLAGANTKCLDEISASGSNFNFQGKPGTTIGTANVRAFLCDGSICQSPDVSKTYYFATANDLAAGGNSFVTNSYGQGPSNGSNWRSTGRFNSTAFVWTGRTAGSANVWSNTPDLDRCSNWSSASASVLGMSGDLDTSDAARWAVGTSACSGTRRLLCVVTKTPQDSAPDPIVFTDVENATPSTQYISNSVTLTGIVGTISLTNSAEIELNNSGSWVTSLGGAANGDTIRIRVNSPATAGARVAVTLSAGAINSVWNVTNFRENLLIATTTTWSGNLGGLAGANTKCLDELSASGNNYDFQGKTGVTLNSTTVTAFLCDATTCAHPDFGEVYWTAVANNKTAGGSSILINNNAQGPNDFLNWSSWSHFQGITGAWTGRDQGSTSLWSINPGVVTSCSNWTDGLVSGTGRSGLFNSTLGNRWSDTASITCNNVRQLLCLVTGTPQTPNVPTAFSFASVIRATPGATYETSAVISGFTGSLTATTQGSGALLRINGAGGWVSSITLVAGDTLNVQAVATTTEGAAIITTVMVGSRAATWTITNLPVITLLTGTSWTVPADWDSATNSIECVGAGGHGSQTGSTGGGGGGGGYSKITNLALTPGNSVSYQIGIGGGGGTTNDSWFSSTATLLAKGGSSTTTNTGGFGGLAGSGVGSTTFSGGTGGNRTNLGGGGGGGAAGKNGAGANGGSASSTGGGGGGGNGGGTGGGTSATSTGGAGGNNSLGLGSGSGGTNGNSGNNGSNGGGGGGGGNGQNGGNGGSGVELTTGIGSGGGGGGAGDNDDGGNAANYGGGGGGQGGNGNNRGTGSAGVCVIRYTPL